MPKHRSGGKIAGSHSTLIDHAVRVVDAAQALSEVSKIVLGEIVVKKCSQRLKFTEISAGLRLTICGNASLQIVYVYTSNPESTRRALSRVFND